MPYWMLECFTPDDWETRAMLQPLPDVLPLLGSWTIGQPVTTPIPEPLALELFSLHPDDLLELHKEGALVMTRRLFDALAEAGVDNLDAYRTVIRHPVTGFETEDYVLVNVIGLVRAADMARSAVLGGGWNGLLGVDFDSVVLDEDRAADLLMFRLAECTTAVVVHDRVKQHLLRRGFDMLAFIPPEEWMG